MAIIIYVIFGTLDVIRETNDVKLVAEASYTLVIAVMFPLKTILFIENRFVFRKLYVTVKSTLYDAIKADSNEKLLKVVNKGWKIVCSLYIMVSLPLISYVVTACWYYMNGKRVTVSKTTSILMPMKTPYHEIGLLLHSIFMFQAGHTLLMIDMCFVLLMYFFCVACDSTVKILTVEKRQLLESRPEYAIRLSKSLREFYKVHVKQVEYLRDLNVMISWLSLVPLLTVALCTCIILLTMSKGVDLKFVSNLVPVTGELFAYNWFGEQIKAKANDWSMALLNFDWPNLNAKDKKAYYLIVCFMNKNVGVRTAIGDDLSLITMSAVLKFSYQAFTVLQTMDA
uniref:Odorant receptor n=1 Tax=Leucinodes orbonalis TaxID=711050 RepID=A0AAU0QMN2_9NEOP|nr:odorant receptor [Leucinodes orbonalis]